MTAAATVRKSTTFATILPLAIFSAFFASYWFAFGDAWNMHPCDAHRLHWQTVVSEKRAELAAKIPQEWLLSQRVIDHARSRRSIAGDFLDSLLDSHTRDITTREPTEIVREIASGNLSSVEVVTAFCKRASYIHQISPAFLEIGFDLALSRAKELDEYFNTHGQTVGPLHGLPITLKDHFHIKGLETSFGYVGWIGTFEGTKGTGKEKNVESELIRQLVSVGAVPIAKTTLMVSTWAPENNNNILGYSWNPYNQELSTGGSSGGEALVQALRGSAVGFGTDSGGSVSMPSSYHGIYSVKPSPGRLSFKDAAGSGLGNLAITAVVGIMGPSIRTLRLVFKSLMETRPWEHDSSVLPIPWRSDQELSPDAILSFGFMESDGIVAPHPPIARALEIAYSAVKNKGHQLIAWKPPSHAANAMHGPLARGDGCPDVYSAFKSSDEPIVPQLSHLFPDGNLKKPISLPDYQKITQEMMSFRNQYREYWTSTSRITKNGRPVDAVILPVSPYAGFKPGKFDYSAYTSIVNILGYTSAVVQVTFGDKCVDVVQDDYKPLGERDKLNMDTYDADTSDGVPAAIQILGRDLEEEKIFSIAQIVADAIEEYQAKQA
ncbi:Acetamidase [Beauveria bassiana D1-5]|uniref:Acetamidase n=1 Tax=Beauveria bassiana D1-5 TaxID=1245745 RepID=A0A0A2WAP5_BEABA|nr:Acetamidase [Beauveria bassiana D1-5]